MERSIQRHLAGLAAPPTAAAATPIECLCDLEIDVILQRCTVGMCADSCEVLIALASHWWAQYSRPSVLAPPPKPSDEAETRQTEPLKPSILSAVVENAFGAHATERDDSTYSHWGYHRHRGRWS